MSENIYLNLEEPTLLAKGDSMCIPCDVNIDLTDWKIRCEVYDDDTGSIKLATVNSGGTSGDIDIDSAVDGLFTINVAKDLTQAFNDDAYIEIEVENSDGKVYTIYQATFNLSNEKITWTDPTA